MARYLVRVNTRQGTESLQIEAETPREAEIRASSKGAVLSVKKTSFVRLKALSYADRQVFLSRFSAMLASRVGATKALTLMRDNFKGRIRQVSHELLLKVEAGRSVPEAIVALGGRDFPETVTAMIQAAGSSSATHEVLRDAMLFEQTLRDIKKGSSKGIMGALAAFLVGVVFIIGTVFFMVPKIMASPLMKMSGGIANYQSSIQAAFVVGCVMVGLLIMLIVFFMLATVGRKVAPLLADAIILRIPLYKDVVLSKGFYVAFYGLALLIRSGVRMEEAFRLISLSTPPGSLRHDFLMAREAVKNGRSWPDAMKTIQPTDRAALAASLNRIQVADAMNAIGMAYRDMYASRVALLAPILQTLAAASLLISGLAMFGLTMLPIVQMSTKIVG